MKALLLVGGQGTRLRPLTIHAPKSIVPIFNRPFLHYQLDLIKRVPEIDEVILSLNYQPHRIEEVFGDGRDAGIKLRYVVEPTPLGTAGAVRYAAQGVRDTIVVFNGDVLTQVDLRGLIDFHRGRRARATIVLTPVDNPTAYGLVETDAASNILRFLEKPKPEEITCNTINAGIYVLEPETFDRIPADVAWSIERSFFPSFIERARDVPGVDIPRLLDRHRHAREVHAGAPRHHGRPLLDAAVQWRARDGVGFSERPASHEGARLEGPLFVDEGCVVEAGARLGPYTVLGKNCQVEADANVSGAIVWADSRIGREAHVTDTIIGRSGQIGRNVQLRGGVLGDTTSIAEYSRL